MKLDDNATGRSLLGIWDFHGMWWRYSESLQSIFGCSWLYFILKLHKSYVWTAWHQTNLFKSRKSVMQKSKVQERNKSKTMSSWSIQQEKV